MTAAITITEDPPYLRVRAPYDGDFVNDAKRRLGGRWEPATKTWRFALRDRTALEKLLNLHFGYSSAPEEPVDVLLRAMRAQETYSDLAVFGRTILRVYSRDKFFVGPDVLIRSGDVEAGGSRKNPLVRWSKGTEIEVRNLPRDAASRLIRSPQTLLGKDFAADLVEPEPKAEPEPEPKPQPQPEPKPEPEPELEPELEPAARKRAARKRAPAKPRATRPIPTTRPAPPTEEPVGELEPISNRPTPRGPLMLPSPRPAPRGPLMLPAPREAAPIPTGRAPLLLVDASAEGARQLRRASMGRLEQAIARPLAPPLPVERASGRVPRTVAKVQRAELRAELASRLRELRRWVRQARERRAGTVREVRELCRTEARRLAQRAKIDRTRTRDRIREQRALERLRYEAMRAETRDQIKAARMEQRGSCSADLVRAREGTTAAIDAAIAEWKAGKREADEILATFGGRKRKVASREARAERRSAAWSGREWRATNASDEEIADELERMSEGDSRFRDVASAWRLMRPAERARYKATARRSRLESVLEGFAENMANVYEILSREQARDEDAAIRDAEREANDLERQLGGPARRSTSTTSRKRSSSRAPNVRVVLHDSDIPF